MKQTLIISMDAVGDAEYDTLMTYPNFSALAARSATVRRAQSIFLSNTYPIHTSIVTGLPQYRHGVISNVDPFPDTEPFWHFAESNIQATTLWQAAHQKGYKTAAVMWPVTAYSKTIEYNIPEIMARSGQSQMWTSFKAGSALLQIKEFLRHKNKLKGIDQPWRDNWATAAMADIIREKKPELMLMHMTAYDTICHINGRNSAELQAAYRALDDNLGLLLDVVGDDATVIVFSDHAQLNVHTSVQPNDLLVEEGLLGYEKGRYVPGQYECFVACCGGSAFFYPGQLEPARIQGIRDKIQQSTGFYRFLTDDEMHRCGQDTDAAFGFCAQPGYHYENFATDEKATHGYPLDYDGYEVFYMVRGQGYEPGRVTQGGTIQDITAIAAGALGLDMPSARILKAKML